MGPSQGYTSPLYSVCHIRDTWRLPVPPVPADTRTDTVPPCFPSSGRQGQNCREAPVSGISQLHSAVGETKAKTLTLRELPVISTQYSPSVLIPFFPALSSFHPFLPPSFFHLTFTLWLHCIALFFPSVQNFSLHHFSFHFAYPLPTDYTPIKKVISWNCHTVFPPGVCLVHFICELLMEEAV